METHARRQVFYLDDTNEIVIDDVYRLHSYGVIAFQPEEKAERVLIPWHRVISVIYDTQDTNFELNQ